MAGETALPSESVPVEGTPAGGPQTFYVIEPPKGWLGIDWGELWRYRELLFFLTWRDIKIRYKQAALGAAWAVLQPFVMMVVLSVFFGRLAGLGQQTGGIPYPIWLYAGLLPWQFFAASINSSSNSLVGSANLITKVYFPRLIIPIAAVGTAAVDFAVSSVVLLGMMVFYKVPPSLGMLLLPVLLLGTVLVASGLGMLLSSLTVAYRDFQYVVPFVVQVWFFLTPVIYPSAIVPAKWRWVLALNPMAGLMEGFRAAFLGQPLPWAQVAISFVVAGALFAAGALYFRRMERSFADVI